MPNNNLRYEVVLVQCLIGRPPYERVVALAEDVKAALVICEAFRNLYVTHCIYRERRKT